MGAALWPLPFFCRRWLPLKLKSVCSGFAHHVKKDPVLFAAMAAAVLSAFFVPPSPAYWGYLDVRVLCLLLSLMLAVAGLQKAGAFGCMVDRLLMLARSTRMLTLILVGVCFFSSMLITNDVALITFVPLAVLLLKRTGQEELLIPVIVLQTVAANLGSMLTPMGNPQNLYLYSLFQLTAGEFLSIMLRPAAFSLILLLSACFCLPSRPIVPAGDGGSALRRRDTAVWLALFLLCILTVVHVVHYAAALAVVVLAAVILDRKLLAEADYALLLTFVFFFIFIGNMKSIPMVSDALSALVVGREMTVGILLSQIISNVPAAMLLSGFTGDYAPLLLGVNLGGLGTLIASMASLISYKLYAAVPGARAGKYMAVFTGVNVLFLAVLWLLTAVVG